MWALKDKAQETALCPSPHTYEAGFSSYSAEGLLQAQDVFNKIWPSLSRSSAAGEEDQCVSSMTERDSTEKMDQLRPQGPSGVSQTAYSAAITEEGVRCPLCSPCPSPKYHFLCTESWDLPSFSYATVCLKRPARLK